MYEMHDNDAVSVSEKSQMQLAVLDEKEKKINEAYEILNDIEKDKNEYYKAVESLQQRESYINELEKKVNILFQESEKEEEKYQK